MEYGEVDVESKSLEILLRRPKGNTTLVKIVSVEVEGWE